MSNKIASTLLATSALPLDISTGFKTLSTSLDAVAYDKSFTIVDWSTNKTISVWDGLTSSLHCKYYTKTLWDFSLNISGRLFIGVAGPAYALTCAPTMGYTDGAITSETHYTYCLPFIFGIPLCTYVSDTKPTNPKATKVTEIESKHLPRTVTVDDWGQVLIEGGFIMGIWLYLSIDCKGSFFGKGVSYIGQTQTNLLHDAIIAGMAIAYLLSGNPAGAGKATASVTQKITSAIKSNAKYVGGEALAGVLDGNAESFFDQAKTGLESKSGATFDPKCVLNANLLDFIPYFSTVVGILGAIGLNLTVGPYITIHFPIALTVTALSVNGQSGAVTGYSPVTADVGPTNTASGAPGTVSVSDPTVSAPSTVGIELTAVPGVDLEIGFTAGISFGSYFNENWTVDVSTDMTSFINSLLGTIPSQVVNSLSNNVGSMSAGSVKKG